MRKAGEIPSENNMPFDSGSMIMESLRGSIGNAVSPNILNQVSQEIENSGSRIASATPLTAAASAASATNAAHIESVLLHNYDVYDLLIEVFRNVDINSDTATKLTQAIRKIEASIRLMGGKELNFQPEDVVSGLSLPDQSVAMSKVVATTSAYYKMGSVRDSEIINKNTIRMTFALNERSNNIVCQGDVTPSTGVWIGNEAIDYVYTPEGGRMTVKLLSQGGWVNVSSDYKINWELLPQEAPVASSRVKVASNHPTPVPTPVAISLNDLKFTVQEKE